MCGIVGYTGEENALNFIVEGLTRIDYRGYDSFGIAIASPEKIHVQKKVGSITDNGIKRVFGTAGIGHTRWATHGRPTKNNAHPHTNVDGNIAVVHNGIIENFSELRQELTSYGYTFQSETDTEVIPHLMDFFQHQGCNFLTSFQRTLAKIKGSSAIAAVHSADSSTILLGCNGAPLNIGIGDEETYFSSDIVSFLDKTNQVVRLRAGEMAIAKKGEVDFFTQDGHKTEKEIETITWSRDAASKEGYPHFMIKEIHEQAESIVNACSQDTETLKKIVGKLKKSNKIVIIASGTSYHAGFVTQHLFLEKGVPCQIVLASEFETYKKIVDSDTTLIAISQSGETADLLVAVKSVLDVQPYVLAITNVTGSSITTISNDTLMINAGPEIAVASTKAYTGQITVLELLAGLIKENTKEEKIKNIKEKIRVASENIKLSVEENNTQIEKIATSIKDSPDIYVLGRGINYPTAREGALKIKEISYIHAEGMASGELKHGTLALIEEGVPAIFIAPSGKDYKHTISNAIEMKSRGAKIIGISDVENEVFDEHIKIPSNALPELTAVVQLQLISYHLAVLRGNNPDKPRNLAKSVTVV